MLFATAAVCVFLAFPWLSLADEAPCTVHDGGNYYDLNPLKASKDYEFTTEGGHQFYMNVCKSVTTDTWNIDVPNPGDVAGFIRRDHGDLSVGVVNTTLEMKEGGLMMRLSEGSRCPNSDMLASTFIRFICDNSVYAAGKPALLDQFPSDDENACHFEFEWKTHYACPVGERGIISGILIFVIITSLIALMIFIVGSTLYNRFVLRRRGFEQVPKFSFSQFSELLSICGDFIQESIDRLRSSRPSGPNSFSHHWNGGDDVSGAGRGFTRATGTREEEEVMIGSQEDEDEGRELHNVHDAHVWGTHPEQSPQPEGMDSQGVIRL
ncbi:hypothetical protein SERLA73DRAFT_174558 [Serpula lacrymans var. lacrymans S7.3]|uniref:MRH domain-containing protein n=2 Tax=Serpula lacrymans var. lacrymans TaxID=341189 RepID=F8PGI6_SERL3|nr:uncharacterized protein SERLADRAFT_456155 [Serpula lacrymans var. lacrymans S7.9]EGO05419.1 hypothetical protein SERLA73DRAFT_174558 [Serpula lacrymans var. lacrymans S7.3]EGO31266.1 hypothetical protein SERLADRAFT_456155 [Serpula lacrymans var. lacrymans S7.9]